MSELKVGFSRTVINPMMGIGISGYFKPRYADGILDDLEAEVLSITKDDTTVLLISVDTLELRQNTIDDIRNRINKEYGIPEKAIFISATHTHLGPYTGYVEEGAPEDLTNEYTEIFTKKVVELAGESLNDQKVSKMGYAIKELDGLSFIRRYIMKDGSIGTNPGVNNPDIIEPLGEPDKDIVVLRFDREDGDTIVLTHFACHPDTIGGNKISADWPGFYRRTFEKAVDNTKCLFFNGAQGDINHIKVFPTGGDMNDMFIDFDDVPRGYSHARFMGRAVAGAVLQMYDKVEYVDVDSVKFNEITVNLPSNMPTKKEAIEAHKIHDLHVAGKDDEIPFSGMMLTTVVAEAERMCNLENGPESIPMYLSALSIGKIAFVGIAGEPFNAIGVGLKEANGWDAILPCCLTNGCVGYFPMMDSYEEGGYEARSSMFKAGVGELIIEKGVELLDSLK